MNITLLKNAEYRKMIIKAKEAADELAFINTFMLNYHNGCNTKDMEARMYYLFRDAIFDAVPRKIEELKKIIADQ